MSDLNDAEKLRSICDQVLADPTLAADGDTTYCNVGVQKIAHKMGHDEFAGKMANDIYDFLKENWFQVLGPQGNMAANQGLLVIAAQKGDPHGHVAVLYPGAMVDSGKWNKECPVVANIGKRNGVMGANWAFETEPEYFVGKQGGN